VTLPYTLYSLYTLSLYRPSTTSLSTLLPTLPFLISTLLPASHSPWITKVRLGKDRRTEGRSEATAAYHPPL